MFRVSVIYANDPGFRFDLDYYTSNFAQLVNEKLKSLGLRRFKVRAGAGESPPFLRMWDSNVSLTPPRFSIDVGINQESRREKA